MPIDPEPVPTLLDLIIQEQQEVMLELFNISPGDNLYTFELSGSPIDGSQIQGTNPDTGVGTWTTRVVDQYDWLAGYLAGDIDETQLQDLVLSESGASLLIGRFVGTHGEVDVVAIGFQRRDEDNQMRYWLIPVMEVSQIVAETLSEVPSNDVIGLVAIVNCDTCDYGCCDERYRGRLREALSEYTKCMKDLVPPLSLGAIACFVACVPLLAGTPLAYAACVAACVALVSTAPTAITTVVCDQELEHEKEGALLSYCSCLEWKENNCPGGNNEIDIHGCP